MKTNVYLLRHGECEGGSILRGQVDVPLSSVGLGQMQAAVKKLPKCPDIIVSSSLRRCAQFANQLHGETGIDVHVDDGLQEINFGDWDGQPSSSYMSPLGQP